MNGRIVISSELVYKKSPCTDFIEVGILVKTLPFPGVYPTFPHTFNQDRNRPFRKHVLHDRAALKTSSIILTYMILLYTCAQLRAIYRYVFIGG